MHQCPRCPPATPKALIPRNFHRNAKRKSGFLSVCRACKSAQSAEQRVRRGGVSDVGRNYPELVRGSRWRFTEKGTELEVTVTALTRGPYGDVLVLGFVGAKRRTVPAKTLRATGVCLQDEGAA